MIARVPKKPHNQANLTPPAVSKNNLLSTYRAVLAELVSNIGSTKCDRLVKLLESLEYKVRKGTSGNHHVYSHPKMKHFYGGDFDCGHGRNPVIEKKVYIRNVIRILESHSDYFDPPQKKDNGNGV